MGKYQDLLQSKDRIETQEKEIQELKESKKVLLIQLQDSISRKQPPIKTYDFSGNGSVDNSNDDENDGDANDNENIYVIEKEWTSKNIKLDDGSNNSNHITGKYTGYMQAKTENPHGEGTLRLNDFSLYIGKWNNGLYNGNGVYIWENGDLYYGHWMNGKQHGKGAFAWSDGRLYSGNYEFGLTEGNGIMTWPYGASYEGQFHKDKRNGRGLYSYPDGRIYSGGFCDDRPHGHGTETDTDGSILYMGQWSMGEFLAKH